MRDGPWSTSIQELADIMRQHETALAELDYEARRWRGQLEADLAAMEAREAEQPEPDEQSVVPRDAPPEYALVMARVDRGELDWLDVVAGNTDDRDAYAVHRWLFRHLDQVRDAIQSMSDEELIHGTAKE